VSVLTNTTGQLRAGWRLLIWLAIVACLAAVLQLAVDAIFHPGGGAFLDPVRLITNDVLIFIPALIAVIVMKRIEHRNWSDYYWPGRDLIGKLFWQGVLWGLAAMSLNVGLIAAFGGYRVTGLAITGMPLLRFSLLWLLAAFAIGVVEEFVFRSYQLRTLADGIGFWPAASVLSIIFGALHYFTKPNERWEDWVSVSFIALFGCFTVRCTGTLAFIIGWHAAFDWAAMFFWSGRNAGELGTGHLLVTRWSGSDRLTGGILGPEASWMMSIVIVLSFVGLTVLYPAGKVKARAAG